MGGQLRGTVEALISNTTADGTRDCFAVISKALDAHPQMTRIASNDGASGAGLTGFTGDADASGENAFGVWRWANRAHDLYILVQWAYTAAFGTAPGNPGVANNSGNGVAIAVAADTAGDSPWNGTTVNDGTDTKDGSEVWTPGTGELVVWPYANSIGGTYVAIKEAAVVVAEGAGRLFILIDRDALWIGFDAGDTGAYDFFTYVGPYGTRQSIVQALPIVMLNSDVSAAHVSESVPHGTAGGASSSEGAITDPDLVAVKTAPVSLSYDSNLLTSALHPNAYFSPAQHDVYELRLRTSYLIGVIDPELLGVVANADTHDWQAASGRAVFGSGTTAHVKFSCRWPASVEPGTGATKTGVQI